MSYLNSSKGDYSDCARVESGQESICRGWKNLTDSLYSEGEAEHAYSTRQTGAPEGNTFSDLPSRRKRPQKLTGELTSISGRRGWPGLFQHGC